MARFGIIGHRQEGHETMTSGTVPPLELRTHVRCPILPPSTPLPDRTSAQFSWGFRLPPLLKHRLPLVTGCWLPVICHDRPRVSHLPF
jgi:hypothetical protein